MEQDQKKKPKVPIFNNFSAPIIITHKTNRVKSLEIVDLDQILNSKSEENFKTSNDFNNNDVYNEDEITNFINDFEQKNNIIQSLKTEFPPISNNIDDIELLKDIENLINTSPSSSFHKEPTDNDDEKEKFFLSETSNQNSNYEELYNELSNIEEESNKIPKSTEEKDDYKINQTESQDIESKYESPKILLPEETNNNNDIHEDREEEEEGKDNTTRVLSKSFDERTLIKRYRIESNASNDQYSNFESLILDDGLEFMKAFTKTCKPSQCVEICSDIFTIFYKKERGIELLENMIKIEVLNQTSAANLFRNNSITTHMMTCYTRTLGIPYLKSTIGPFLLETLENVNQDLIHYEIDPNKIPSNQNIDQNISNLKSLVVSLISQIIESKHLIPKVFLEICHLLIKCTKDKFPESQNSLIGGFIFLRYICPALVVPDQYHIIEEEEFSKDHRRVLILASKILQTIANDKQFIDKESYMKCMNPLIIEQKPLIQKFFKELCEPISPDAYDNIIPIQIKFNHYKSSMTKFWNFVKSMKDDLLKCEEVKMNKKIYNTILNIENIQLLKTSPIERATFRRHRIFNLN